MKSRHSWLLLRNDFTEGAGCWFYDGVIAIMLPASQVIVQLDTHIDDNGACLVSPSLSLSLSLALFLSWFLEAVTRYAHLLPD